MRWEQDNLLNDMPTFVLFYQYLKMIVQVSFIPSYAGQLKCNDSYTVTCSIIYISQTVKHYKSISP